MILLQIFGKECKVLGKLEDGDVVEIIVDRNALVGSVNFIGTPEKPLTPEEGAKLLAQRPTRGDIQPDERLPAATRLWAALQQASGGTWGGCVYDVDRIVEALE